MLAGEAISLLYIYFYRISRPCAVTLWCLIHLVEHMQDIWTLFLWVKEMRWPRTAAFHVHLLLPFPWPCFKRTVGLQGAPVARLHSCSQCLATKPHSAGLLILPSGTEEGRMLPRQASELSSASCPCHLTFYPNIPARLRKAGPSPEAGSLCSFRGHTLAFFLSIDSLFYILFFKVFI